MIQCPVCEHTQAAGDECEVCGKQLVARTNAAVTVAAIPELELTAVVRPGLQVQTAAMPDLEGTHNAKVAEVPLAPVPELERTRTESVGEIAVAPMLDFDAGRAPDDGERVNIPLTDVVVCRYCRNEQAIGNVCDRCGMRLPRFPQAAAAAKVATEQWTLCHDCGTRGLVGTRCPGCGATVLEAPES